MEIPMPGHPVSPSEAAGVLEDCKRLKELVSSHGAIFFVRMCCIGLVGLHHLFYKGAAGPLGLPPPLAAAPWQPAH
jgi:hypothetical protein